MVGNEFLPPWLPQAELERHNKNTPQTQLCSPNAHVASSTVGDVWRCSIWAINRFTEVTRADLLNELSDLERSRQDSRAVFQPSEDLMRGQPPIHKTGDYSRHNPRRLASRPQTSTPQNSEKEVLLFKLSSQWQVVIVSWAHDNITLLEKIFHELSPFRQLQGLNIFTFISYWLALLHSLRGKLLELHPSLKLINLRGIHQFIPHKWPQCTG